MISSSASLKYICLRVPLNIGRGLSTKSSGGKSRCIGFVSQYDRYQGYGFISPQSPLPGTNSLKDVFMHRNDVDWPDITVGVTRTLEAGKGLMISDEVSAGAGTSRVHPRCQNPNIGCPQKEFSFSLL